MSTAIVKVRRAIPLGTVATYTVFAVVFVIVAFPLVWMVGSSLKSQYAIFSSPFSLPTSFDFSNYATVWNEGHFGQAIVNSLIITVSSVFGAVALSAPAAYAFARLTFPGKKVLFIFILAGLAVPPTAIAIPAYKIMSTLGLVNSYLSLIVTYLSWSPLGVVILTAFFRTQPKEIEEAAKADGAGIFRIFGQIALPLARPALATVAIFYFIYIWNDFLYPLLYLQDESKFTIPLRLMAYSGRYSVNWGAQTAALSIATLVPVAFFLVFQRWFIKGLTAGSVKG